MNNDELKRQVLLMNYDNKKTLTENIDEILSEQGVIKDLVSAGSLVAKELEGVLKTMMADEKVAKQLKNVELSTGGVKTGVRTAEELISAIKLNKLTSSLKGELELAILHSKTTNKTLVDAAASNLVRNQKFLSKYATELSQGQAQYEKALKNAGYSEEAITSIVKQTESIGGKLKSAEDIAKTGKVGETGKAFEGGSKAAEQSSKTTALAKESYIQRFKDKFKEYYNSGKGKLSSLKKKQWFQKGFLKYNKSLGKFVISKRKMLAWAAVAGVTYFAMKDWLNQNGLVEDPNKTDDGGGNGGGGNGGGNGGGGNGGGKTTYSNCTDYPYKKGCQSTVVSEIQGCLGLSTDGKFGPKTEKALTDKGYGTEITKEVYDKIKANCGSSSSTTTTTTINPATNFELTNVDAENASNLFK